MTIEKVLNGENAKIIVVGRLDTQTAPELEKEIDGIIANLKELVFDMSELEYISSAGLRVLLSSHKKFVKLDGMKVVNVVPQVMEIFEITGFADVLTIE